MKKHLLYYLASIMIVGLLAISAAAQSRNRQQLRVDVPFAFQVGDKVLPAGEYRVSIVNPASDQSVLQIAKVDGKATTLARTIDINGWTSANAKLSFRHYGQQYFLAEVWMAGESTGLATPTSRSEKSLRRQIGKENGRGVLVTVDAR